jgi:hypothetical protein
MMVCFAIPLNGQEQEFQIVQADTVSVDTFALEHSPRKAAMYSAVFPGMGQIYNRKYWKLPLVYGGLIGFGYSAIWNDRQYRLYFDLFKYMTDNDLTELDGRTIQEVEFYKDAHLRYKNLMIILTIGFYALQIIDASVDAHLIDYDISNDLSLEIDPVMIPPLTAPANLNIPLRAGSPSGPGVPRSAIFGLRCSLSF